MTIWIPKLFHKTSDGGADSGVTAFFLIEWKPVFSIAILRFNEGSREAYHSHAFNAITFWLKGHVVEEELLSSQKRTFKGPSLKPKYTPRRLIHKIVGIKKSWAITFRGPWSNYWIEFKDGQFYTLTHGRVVV